METEKEYVQGAVELRINTIIYSANFKFGNQYIVCKFLSATAPFILSLIYE